MAEVLETMLESFWLEAECWSLLANTEVTPECLSSNPPALYPTPVQFWGMQLQLWCVCGGEVHPG